MCEEGIIKCVLLWKALSGRIDGAVSRMAAPPMAGNEIDALSRF